MRLTIIPNDGAVYKDGIVYSDLVWNDTPESIHALQWFGNSGWIEFNNGLPNQEITELPEWAQNAIASFEFSVTQDNQTLELSYEQKLAIILTERNKRLSLTDWTELPSVVSLNGIEWSQAWQVYRQALRDMPNDPNNPINVDNPIYPIPPAL